MKYQTQRRSHLGRSQASNVNEFLATFYTGLQAELGALDTQGLGEEAYTGSIGGPLHWRGCQA
jgi:porphobilinogen deaminase